MQQAATHATVTHEQFYKALKEKKLDTLPWAEAALTVRMPYREVSLQVEQTEAGYKLRPLDAGNADLAERIRYQIAISHSESKDHLTLRELKTAFNRCTQQYRHAHNGHGHKPRHGKLSATDGAYDITTVIGALNGRQRLDWQQEQGFEYILVDLPATLLEIRRTHTKEGAFFTVSVHDADGGTATAQAIEQVQKFNERIDNRRNESKPGLGAAQLRNLLYALNEQQKGIASARHR